MPDRHSELVRQRALVLEHLAWLDREIASASAESATPPDAKAVPAPVTAQSLGSSPTGAVPRAVPPDASSAAKPAEEIPSDTEVILGQYRVEPSTLKQDVRKGCLLYFVGAFALLGIVVALLYFAIGTR